MSCSDDSRFKYYYPFKHLSNVQANDIKWWWNNANVHSSFHETDSWNTFYRFIPTKEMICKTLSRQWLHEMFVKQNPNNVLPSVDELINLFLTPNTPWKLSFFKNVRNDHNSYNSGVIAINDTVLVETGEGADTSYHCMNLTHVC